MKKFITLLFIVTPLFIVGAGCSDQKTDSSEKKDTNTIQITTSFYPLAFIAERVGGDSVSVNNLTPTGVDAHDFEPSPQDIGTILESDLFLYQGQGLDPWATNNQEQAIAQGVHVIEMTSAIPETEDFDPHIWLDPVLMQQQTEIVRDELIEIDPDHTDAYTQNAEQLINELEALDEEYTTKLSNCTQESIITSHDAFGYLGERYGFEVIAVAGISPEDEPSAKELADITTLVKEKKINYIFTELLVTQKLSETIEKETGTTTLLLNPLEGLTAELEEMNADYLSEMRKNLTQLTIGLECK